MSSLLFKVVRRYTTRQFGQLRLVPYYATYSFSKLLCFAVGGAGGVEPLPAKRLSAQHCPCFITPHIKCHNFLNLVCRSLHLSPYCGGIRYIYPRGSLQNYLLALRIGCDPISALSGNTDLSD